MKLLIDWDGGSTVVNPGKPFVIGRDKSADIQVVGSKVSRTHLRLEFTGTHWKAKVTNDAEKHLTQYLCQEKNLNWPDQ